MILFRLPGQGIIAIQQRTKDKGYKPTDKINNKSG